MKDDGGRMKERGAVTRPFAAAAVAAVLALAGCDYFGFTPIKDIAATPAQFDGKEVKVKGKASNPVQLFSLRSFTVTDDTGEITVSTNGALPSPGGWQRKPGSSPRNSAISGSLAPRAFKRPCSRGRYAASNAVQAAGSPSSQAAAR